MRLSEIHLGGTYRIREWDDMAAEFGADGLGVKTSGARFTPAMKSLCGMTFTASAYYVSAGEVFLKSEEEVEKRNLPRTVVGDKWFISSDMLEPFFEEPPLEEIPPESLLDFLLN